MPDHILESRVWLPKPRVEVFAFFADPANLARITPPWLGFRLLTERPVMAPYAVLDYRVRWLGLPVSWRTMIREYDPPARFVDVQVRGPYDRWEHRVTYRLPLGPLGRLVHALIVERQLAAIWAYRRQRLSVLVAPVSDAIP